MKRIFTVATATLGLATLALFSGPALAHRGAHVAQATHLKFFKWQVIVYHHGSKLKYTANPGATVRKCSSDALFKLKAYYSASGPTNGKVYEFWKVNGQVRGAFASSSLYRNGYFYVKNRGGLPTGRWGLKVVRQGSVIGRSSLTVKPKHC